VVQVDRAAPLVLVTGASGFVGAVLCAALPAAGFRIRRALRSPVAATPDDTVVGNIGADTAWQHALKGVHAIVHLAARTHVLHETAADPLAEYRRVNVAGTRALAEAATQAGVRRFVFLSSIKVNGERTENRAFRENDVPKPEDAYGVTKLEAEEFLRAHVADSAMHVSVLRPPLIYGPGVKGNFLRLLHLVHRGLPLPLASVENRRSLIYVENLVSAIVACLRAREGVFNTYLVSDGADLSTPALVRSMAEALRVKPRLVRCPVVVLNLLGRAMGWSAEVARLTGSLKIDSSRIGHELGWQPPFTISEGLADTAWWYHAHLGAKSSS
jgi:nucleoside-diphosphate-sugar epimerase